MVPTLLSTWVPCRSEDTLHGVDGCEHRQQTDPALDGEGHLSAVNTRIGVWVRLVRGEVKVVEGPHCNLEKHADRRKKRGHEGDGRLFASRFGPSDRHFLIGRILTLSLLPYNRQYGSFELKCQYCRLTAKNTSLELLRYHQNRYVRPTLTNTISFDGGDCCRKVPVTTDPNTAGLTRRSSARRSST